MDKVKIGVFGAYRGMTMINQTLNNPHAELVAICDKYEPLLDKCREMAKQHGIKVELYTEFDKFIQCDMDAVVLANYADEHAPYAIKCLNSGRHVMSEVLTCSTLAQAVELIETVEKTGKIYSYAENYCYFNTTFEMRKRYKKGDIGELMHGEGEYIHDCSSIWPSITYGERDHWRNRMYSTFYCTHSLGPVLFSTGLRPVKVVGVEAPSMPFMRDLGLGSGSSGMEIVTLENGAMVKSIHGYLKREPGSINYQLYGSKGSMETDRWEWGSLHAYIEGDRNCVGEHTKYVPEFTVKDAAGAGHGGGDFFTTYYFINSILGDEESKNNIIDVYQAVDMCIPGILAFRSILNGGSAIEVPNLRLKQQRDMYRNDDIFYLDSKYYRAQIPDSVYDKVKDLWIKGENG